MPKKHDPGFARPLAAAVAALSYYAESESARPFTEFYAQHELAKAENYRQFYPSLGTRDSLDISNLEVLIFTAMNDTRRIFRISKRFLKRLDVEPCNTVPIIENSLPMARQFASLDQHFIKEFTTRVNRAPADYLTYQAVGDVVQSLIFKEEVQTNILLPNQAQHIGCSALGINIRDASGNSLNLFDTFWPAFVREVATRQAARQG